MSKRTGLVRRAGSAPASARTSEAAETRSADGFTDTEDIAAIALPRDHPKWLRDRFVVSSATKALLATLRPLAIAVFGFWDHRVHRLEMETATIAIDDSGAYRSV